MTKWQKIDKNDKKLNWHSFCIYYNRYKLKNYKIMFNNNFFEHNLLFDSLFETVFKSHYTTECDAYIWFDEENKEYNIKVKVPGWNKDEINIEVEIDKMSISSDLETKDERCKYGVYSFKYFVKVRNIDSKSVNAQLENGILTIKFKIEKSKSLKKIEIK